MFYGYACFVMGICLFLACFNYIQYSITNDLSSFVLIFIDIGVLISVFIYSTKMWLEDKHHDRITQ